MNRMIKKWLRWNWGTCRGSNLSGHFKYYCGISRAIVAATQILVSLYAFPVMADPCSTALGNIYSHEHAGTYNQLVPWGMPGTYPEGTPSGFYATSLGVTVTCTLDPGKDSIYVVGGYMSGQSTVANGGTSGVTYSRKSPTSWSGTWIDPNDGTLPPDYNNFDSNDGSGPNNNVMWGASAPAYVGNWSSPGGIASATCSGPDHSSTGILPRDGSPVPGGNGLVALKLLCGKPGDNIVVTVSGFGMTKTVGNDGYAGNPGTRLKTSQIAGSNIFAPIDNIFYLTNGVWIGVGTSGENPDWGGGRGSAPNYWQPYGGGWYSISPIQLANTMCDVSMDQSILDFGTISSSGWGTSQRPGLQLATPQTINLTINCQDPTLPATYGSAVFDYPAITISGVSDSEYPGVIASDNPSVGYVASMIQSVLGGGNNPGDNPTISTREVKIPPNLAVSAWTLAPGLIPSIDNCYNNHCALSVPIKIEPILRGQQLTAGEANSTVTVIVTPDATGYTYYNGSWGEISPPASWWP